jgi:hypothetical protein
VSAKMQTSARFKFTSRIARPNCTVMFAKGEKSSATVFKARCKRTSWNCHFMQNKPYPLSKQGFYGSPIARRKLRGVPRDGHAMGAQHPARHPAQRPGNGRTVATAMPLNVRQDDWQDNLPCSRLGRAMSAPETCETTRRKPQPSEAAKFATQLATRCNNRIST